MVMVVGEVTKQTAHVLTRPPVADAPLVLTSVKRGTLQLPEDSSLPVLMAGLGTGIAPFKAITEHRVAQAAAGQSVGPTALFYGCRYKREFLYADLWKKYHEMGVLTHVIPAFSREQEYKIYVQDRLVENCGLVSDMLVDKGGHFYYCGLAGRTPGQVRGGVRSALMSARGWGEDKAEAYLESMEKEGRYSVECW